MAQLAVPDADIQVGGWTPSTGITLWQVWDDQSSGGDYASEFTLGFSPDGVVRLSDVTDPAVSTGHIIKAEMQTDLGACDITANLYEGNPLTTGVLRASLVVSGVAPSWTLYTYTLSAGEANSITDYTNLYMEVNSSPGKGDTAYVGYVYLEVPDAGGGGGISKGIDFLYHNDGNRIRHFYER